MRELGLGSAGLFLSRGFTFAARWRGAEACIRWVGRWRCSPWRRANHRRKRPAIFGLLAGVVEKQMGEPLIPAMGPVWLRKFLRAADEDGVVLGVEVFDDIDQGKLQRRIFRFFVPLKTERPHPFIPRLMSATCM